MVAIFITLREGIDSHDFMSCHLENGFQDFFKYLRDTTRNSHATISVMIPTLISLVTEEELGFGVLTGGYCDSLRVVHKSALELNEMVSEQFESIRKTNVSL